MGRSSVLGENETLNLEETHVTWECPVAQIILTVDISHLNIWLKIKIYLIKSEYLYGDYKSRNIKLKYVIGSLKTIYCKQDS